VGSFGVAFAKSFWPLVSGAFVCFSYAPAMLQADIVFGSICL